MNSNDIVDLDEANTYGIGCVKATINEDIEIPYFIDSNGDKI